MPPMVWDDARMNHRITRRLHAGIALLGFGLFNIICPVPANMLNMLLSLLGFRYGFRLD